jgi:hypothetical protein
MTDSHYSAERRRRILMHLERRRPSAALWILGALLLLVLAAVLWAGRADQDSTRVMPAVGAAAATDLEMAVAI